MKLFGIAYKNKILYIGLVIIIFEISFENRKAQEKC